MLGDAVLERAARLSHISGVTRDGVGAGTRHPVDDTSFTGRVDGILGVDKGLTEGSPGLGNCPQSRFPHGPGQRMGEDVVVWNNHWVETLTWFAISVSGLSGVGGVVGVVVRVAGRRGWRGGAWRSWYLPMSYAQAG